MESYQRIRQLRKEILNMTLKEFSDKIGMSRSNLGNIETGRINLTERVLSDICRNFKVNRDWITDGNLPVFINDDEPLTDEILRLYSYLTVENKEYLFRYMQNLLDEQMELQNGQNV